MRILLISASKRQPSWIDEGFSTYARRLKGSCSLELVEVTTVRRSGSVSATKARAQEGARMLRACPVTAHVIALTQDGERWSTGELTRRLRRWMALGRPVCLLVGGPDGLSAEALARSQERWCVSPLTLPHGLVRVVLAEALYRAWTLTQGHPYHRA